MAKYIRDRAGVPRGFGQNPVEWLHYMSKLEIDAEGDGVKHRDTSLTAAISSLKNRVMRLYQDATKALYGQGPYRLDEEYKKFSLDYDSWKDMSLEERKPVMKRFLTSVCCPPVLASRDNPVTTASDDETKSIQNNESASGVPSISKIPEVRRLSISADQFGIAEEILPNSTLRDMIRNAEALLNEPGAILPAASEDPRMRTVKSRLGKVPLIVKPSKTGNQLECQCSVYTAVGICQDTIAVAEDLDWLEKYAEVIRKKFLRKQGTGVNLTTAYNARKTLKEKGMKPDEIKKVARRKKKEMKESWQPSTPSRSQGTLKH
ncbi:uncharacterized protein LOC114540691 [Dendronephthya gigantea]|uniref:uncharacterized protein LOC114540691 n=1 Tax=Dendronephthya gigantea TaxID=151771 RepID=UPI00106C5C48|nr:uncharacterized protein LOC114540691 [Dendronephthya gigantea]